MPTFCRHNRFVERCPICSRAEAATPAAPASPRPTRTPRRGATGRRRGGEVRVRRAAQVHADGYANPLAPGVRSSAQAQRLTDELAFAAGRLALLEREPPGTYAEAAAARDAEEGLWLVFLTTYLAPLEEGDAFAGIRAAALPWASGCAPDLAGVPTGPRTAHVPERGPATLDAYRAWAGRAGGQRAALTGESAWTPARRAERAFERLALPGLHRGARLDFLLAAGRLGLADLEPARLHLQGSDPTTVAAKRVFGIGEPLLLERRASALAEAAGVPVAALDLALHNWQEEGRRATCGADPGAAAAVADRGAIAAALGIAA